MNKFILIALVGIAAACSSSEQAQQREEASDYRPAISPPLGVPIGMQNSSGQPVEPGSLTSPQVQRLPKAKVKK